MTHAPRRANERRGIWSGAPIRRTEYSRKSVNTGLKRSSGAPSPGWAGFARRHAFRCSSCRIRPIWPEESSTSSVALRLQHARTRPARSPRPRSPRRAAAAGRRPRHRSRRRNPTPHLRRRIRRVATAASTPARNVATRSAFSHRQRCSPVSVSSTRKRASSSSATVTCSVLVPFAPA